MGGRIKESEHSPQNQLPWDISLLKTADEKVKANVTNRYSVLEPIVPIPR